MIDIFFIPLWRFTTRSIRGEAINIIQYLSSFYYHHIFPKGKHGILIGNLGAPKINFLSHINIWYNIIDPVNKIRMVMIMNVGSNKGICIHIEIIVFGCIYDHDQMTLVNLFMHIPPQHLHRIPSHTLVMVFLEYIVHLIKRAYHSLLLTKLYPLLGKNFKEFSEIYIRLQAILCE